jgi:hypothetical protein
MPKSRSPEGQHATKLAGSSWFPSIGFSYEQAKSLLASRPGFYVSVATDLSEAQLIECIGDYDGIIVRYVACRFS